MLLATAKSISTCALPLLPTQHPAADLPDVIRPGPGLGYAPVPALESLGLNVGDPTAVAEGSPFPGS